MEQDLVEVLGEGGAREALHVLEDERARTGLAHSANRLRKHVALVQEAAVLAAHGKGLARRTADDQVDAVEGVVLEVLDVAFRHVRPMADRRDLVLLVVADGVAGVRVPLDHSVTAHIVAGKPERQPAHAREQFDRIEGARRQHQRWFVKREQGSTLWRVRFFYPCICCLATWLLRRAPLSVFRPPPLQNHQSNLWIYPSKCRMFPTIKEPLRLTMHEEWNERATNLLKSEMARAGVGYDELISRLQGVGIDEGYKGLANKINRGAFSFVFFIQCMKALGITEVRL